MITKTFSVIKDGKQTPARGYGDASQKAINQLSDDHVVYILIEVRKVADGS